MIFRIALFLFCFESLFAQSANLSGSVKDSKGNPLIGANVILLGSFYGAATDSKGEYILKSVKPGKYVLQVSMVGYNKFLSDSINLTGSKNNFDITLVQTAFQVDQIVVTAGKRSQDISELPVSASIISAEEFSKKNYSRLDQALRYVSGVNVNLDQVSIRGSSGYSRGVGTRVLVAIDGIPIYTGDSGEIIWAMVPTTEIGRVEIIKGAASSLYGSTALGGVINIISKEITSNPLTLVKTYYGVYSSPSHKEWDWSDKTRSFNGITVSHSQKFGSLGISASITRTEDLSYRLNDWQNRTAGFLKANYQFDESTSLTFLTSGFKRNRGSFIYWKNLQNALVPPDADVGQRTPSERYLFGLSLNHIFTQDLSISFKPSFYRNFWKDESESANSSSSNLYKGEVQVNYKFSPKSVLTSGIEGTYGKVKSSIFGDNSSNGLGVYASADYRLDIPITISIGARFDLNQLDTLKVESDISPKIGMNYKLNQNTIIRANFGKGFRAPSLAEAFTSTTTSGIIVKPNPDIKAETNYTAEVGLNYSPFEFFNMDLAVFHSEYYDLIEPVIDALDGEVFFDNVTRARIQGFEFNTVFENLEYDVKLKFGYTFLNAKNIENNKFLKYRPKHQLITSVEYSPGIYTFGVDFRFASKVEEIDFELVELGLVPDGDARVKITVVDLIGGVNFYSLGVPLNLYLNVNNLLNYNYVEMIGNIAPIRNFSINLELLF